MNTGPVTAVKAHIAAAQSSASEQQRRALSTTNGEIPLISDLLPCLISKLLRQAAINKLMLHEHRCFCEPANPLFFFFSSSVGLFAGSQPAFRCMAPPPELECEVVSV